MKITVIATGFDKDMSDAGTTHAEPRARYSPPAADVSPHKSTPLRSDDLGVPTFIRKFGGRISDDAPPPESLTRSDDLDVPTFIRKKADINASQSIHPQCHVEPIIPSNYLADFLIVWNPKVVDEEDYVSLITALGDLVRSKEGIGVERIAYHGFDTPIRVRFSA
jgi:hypothetical protein